MGNSNVTLLNAAGCHITSVTPGAPYRALIDQFPNSLLTIRWWAGAFRLYAARIEGGFKAVKWMHIRKFEVHGLLGAEDRVISYNLNSDLNIFTGRNGSGKTTILKLMWYMISGNIEHAIREVPFNRATIVTDQYELTLNVKSDGLDSVEITSEKGNFLISSEFDEDNNIFNDAETDANNFVKDFGVSVFFPTFRRIEGGFSLSATPSRRLAGGARVLNALDDALVDLSRRLSVQTHTFVSSLSTRDVATLLLRQYNDISEGVNVAQQNTSSTIIDMIRSFKQEAYEKPLDAIDRDVQPNAIGVLDNIRVMIEDLDRQRETIMSPYNAVQNLVQKLLKHKGIRLGPRVRFGDAANAVNSEVLSAGEKQMLSFVCYNAFQKNGVIFIDEPELSLHVDWQRQLFPVLMSQNSTNQFIIATHSPFIYSKYPDKELLVHGDKGDESSEALQ